MPSVTPASLRRFALSVAPLLVALIAAFPWTTPLRAATIWVEGEHPVNSTMHRHPWWYDQVKKDLLSGHDLISNFHDQPGEAAYDLQCPKTGDFDLWIRANPIQSEMAYQLNGGPWKEIDLSSGGQDQVNIAADNKPDLRFLAWFKVGKVALPNGKSQIRFRMHGKNHNHGYLDCFLLTDEPFHPRGALKPHEMAAAMKRLTEESKGWFAFAPDTEKFRPSSGFDLRSLNEDFAGQGGFIGVRDGQFIHGKTGQPLRFWAVNGPPGDLKDRQALRDCGRLLAKYGVNLVRIHGGYYDQSGALQPEKVQHVLDVVEAMKPSGVYSHLSIYFPLWLQPKPGTPWLPGYDGHKHPFAALYFNPKFQEQYRAWWKAVLLTPDKTSGRPLVDEPALASVEIINEDSYFFWTFSAANIPDPELRMLETQFGDWLKRKYGSIELALRHWNNQKVARDDPAEGRVGFRPLWNMFNEKSLRDQDTAAFLCEGQWEFYRRTYKLLRELGFKGSITASNWSTASPQIFGPLEKLTYTAGDFIDRHGYFGCKNQGEAAEWSLRDGQTYIDRSALRFEAEEPGKPRQFVHPVMDPHYNGKPSMISETTFCRPNRYRSEAPLYYAAYGALQGSDAIVHFAFDGDRWNVKPGFFMQPWTLATPAMLGQFPAAALLYRKALVAEGETLVDLNLNSSDLLQLKGTPLPQDAALDELRLKDVPRGTEIRPGQVIGPLVHYAGRTRVNIGRKPASVVLGDLSRWIDHKRQTVASTTGELRLDYGRGLLTIDAPAAQGASGAGTGGATANEGPHNRLRSRTGAHRGRQPRRPPVGHLRADLATGHERREGIRFSSRAGRQRVEADRPHRPGPLARTGDPRHGEVQAVRRRRAEGDGTGSQRLSAEKRRHRRGDPAGADDAVLLDSTMRSRNGEHYQDSDA